MADDGTTADRIAAWLTGAIERAEQITTEHDEADCDLNGETCSGHDAARMAGTLQDLMAVHRQHISDQRPGSTITPTFPPPGICVHDHQRWPCSTVALIGRDLLEGDSSGN